jgi:hypothetical protein
MQEPEEVIIEPGTHRSLANPQYVQQPFTDFASIGPETDLGSLNLSWREKDLPERARTKHVHRLHPYLGKFVPQLVEVFLRKFRPKLVVDPFAGSGTTLVEAAVLGFDSFGCDVAPFNCLLAKVKTSRYDVSALAAEQQDVLRQSARACHSSGYQLQLLDDGARVAPTDHTLSSYLREWYDPQALCELLAFLDQIPGRRYADYLSVLLSRAARSARLTPHHELDFPKVPQKVPYYCRKHRRICQPTREARKFLARYAGDSLRRVREFMSLRSEAKAEVICADAREVEWPECDLVITSPPYLGLIDYHEQHRYAYELLSLLPEPFASIGWTGDPLTGQRWREIGRPAAGQSAAARQAYLDAVRAVLNGLAKRMVGGGHIVCVVADKLRLYEGIARDLGFQQIHVLRRHVNRRTGRRTADFFEEVYVWRVC